AADHAEVKRAIVDQRRIFVYRFERLQDVILEPDRIVHGVEREGMLISTWRLEEVHYRSQSENQVVIFEWRPAIHRNLSFGRVDARDNALVEGGILIFVQQLANGKAHLPGGQFIHRYLIEQRLERVIVILVDQSDSDVGVPQFFECADPTETGA